MKGREREKETERERAPSGKRSPGVRQRLAGWIETTLDTLLRCSQTSTRLWEALKWYHMSLREQPKRPSAVGSLPPLWSLSLHFSPCWLFVIHPSNPPGWKHSACPPQYTPLLVAWFTLSPPPGFCSNATASGFLWMPCRKLQSSPFSTPPSTSFLTPFCALTFFSSTYCYLFDFLCIWLLCWLNVSSSRLEILVCFVQNGFWYMLIVVLLSQAHFVWGAAN